MTASAEHDTHPAPVPPPVPDRAVPSLADDELLQLWLADLGVRHVVAEDGRYLVAHSGGELAPAQPVSRYGTDGDRLSARGLDAIRAAVRSCGFAELAESVAGRALPADTMLPNGEPVRPLHLVYSARVDGAVRAVHVTGHPDLAWSVGVLEPVQQVLNDEVLGTSEQE